MNSDATRPDWTVWSAAYAYASVMRGPRLNPDGRDPDAQAKTLVAHVIAETAAAAGIRVEHPRDLAELPMDALRQRLDPMRLAGGMAKWKRTVRPAPGEPGREEFERLELEVDDQQAQAHRNPAAIDSEGRLKDGQRWIDRAGEAERLLVAGMVQGAQLTGGTDATLGGLADLLPRDDTDDSAPAGLTAILMDNAFALRPAAVPIAIWWNDLADLIGPAFADRPRSGDPGWSWIPGEAMVLVQLTMYVAAHDRGELARAVPWSAARLRLQLGPDGLRSYLDTALARLGHTDSSQLDDIPAVIWSMYQNGRLSRMHGVDDTLTAVLPYAVERLDRVLIAERGGHAPGSDVLVALQPGDRPQPMRIVAPVWDHAVPPGERAARIDLVAGPPAAYLVADPGTGDTATARSDAIVPVCDEPA
ncbi:hypothetical protein [Amycolatopsis sp. NPDC004079]|uniref:hypothetical protein n=1 Tax=Amycolatopsis sp. NPDC004079 TaxID=3154549 RepID=UPI0033A59CD7